MATNPGQPRPAPFMEWAVTKPLTLIVGMVTAPVLAIALGVCFAILANALR
jgi:hypothetical protein